MQRWWMLVLAAGILTTDVRGQCGMTPRAILGDRALEIAKVGESRLVVLKATSLDLYDLSDPGAPVRIAQLNPSTSPGTSKPFMCMTTDGDRIYAGFEDQVWILDGSGAGLSVLGTVSIPSRLHRVQLHDGVMLTAAESQTRFGSVEFRAVDVHDPAAPVALGSTFVVGSWQYTPGRAAWMYVSTTSGVMLVDFTDPAHPSTTATGISPALYRTPALDGSRLWVSDPAGTRAYDVSIPSAPRSLGVYPVDISGVTTVDGVSYFTRSSPSRLVAADLSDVANPVILGESPATGVYVPVAPGLLAAAYSTGLRTLDVTHPEAMLQRSVAAEITAPIEQVTSAGSVVAAFTASELVTLDVSDPEHPRRLGSTPFSSSGSPGPEAAAGNNGVVVFVGNDRLTVFDVSDPAAPRARGTLALASSLSRDAAVEGRLAAVKLQSTIGLVDLTDLDAPRLAGEIPVAPRFSSLTHASLSMDGGRLAIAASTSPYVRLYSVADPARPSLLRRWDLLSQPIDSVALRGGVLACASFSSSGLILLDAMDESRIGMTEADRAFGSFIGVRTGPDGIVTDPPGFIDTEGPEGAYLHEWIRADLQANWINTTFAAVPGAEAVCPSRQGLWLFGRGQPQPPAIRGGFSTARGSLHPCVGEPFELSIDAVSSTGEISFQWYDRYGHAMPGETSSTLRIPRFTQASALSYSCIATNACGSTAYADGNSFSSMWAFCTADFNCDRFVDFFDYGDFVDAFERGDLKADVNGDEFLDFFDYSDFVAAFERGC